MSRLSEFLELKPDHFERVHAKMTAAELHSLLTAIRVETDRDRAKLENALKPIRTWAEFDVKSATKRKGQYVPAALVAADVVRLIDKAMGAA